MSPWNDLATQPGHLGIHTHSLPTCLAPQTSENQGRTGQPRSGWRGPKGIRAGETHSTPDQGSLTTTPWSTPLQGFLPPISAP